MSISFDSMTLILPQIKFETIPSKDAGEVAFQPEADRSHQILGFCHNSFSLIAHMALILKFFDSRIFKNVLRHTNSDRTPLKTHFTSHVSSLNFELLPWQQNYKRYLAEFGSIEKGNF